MTLCVEHLSFSYGRREVLHDVSFTVETGSLLSVLGPNGVGKSTLFRCILGLEKGYSGRITLDGRDVSGLKAGQLARQVAYIPQSHAPFFGYTAFDMVLMGTSARLGWLASPGRAEEAVARQAMERMELLPLRDREYTRLSGGEQQMVLLARALAQQAPVFIMDEPTANLDYGNQIRVLRRIRALAEEGYLILQSTHDPELAYLFSHEVLAMRDGTILARGTPGQVMDDRLIQTLYGVETETTSLHGDTVRVYVPKFMINEEKKP